MGSQETYAPDTESAVIGSALLNGAEWWREVRQSAGLDNTPLFYGDEHGNVARAMDSMLDTDAAFAPAVLQDRLASAGLARGRAESIVDRLVECASIGTIEDLRKSCQELARYRAVRDMSRVLQDSIEDVHKGGVNDPAAIRMSIQNSLSNVALPVPDPPTGADLLNKLESGTAPSWAIPTGLDELDDHINGGWAAGRTYIIAAGTKVGKTTLAISSMERALVAGAVVVVFSLETIEQDFAAKLIANMSQLDRNKKVIPVLTAESPEQAAEILTGYTDDERTKFMNARALIRNSNLYPIFQRHLTSGGSSIVPLLKEIKDRHPDSPIVAFVDHINLLTDAKSRIPTHEQLGMYTKEFAEVAQSLEMAIVQLMQINRDPKDGEPELHNLQGSGQPAQNSNTVILLHRNRTDIPNENGDDRDENGNYHEDMDPHEMLIHVAANRNGKNGRFYAYFDGAKDFVGNEESDEDDWDEDWDE